MAQQLIGVGTVANDRTGDTWRDAFIKVNANETELYKNAVIDKVFTVTTLQDIKDIPGIVESGNDLIVSSLGTFTVQVRGAIDMSPFRFKCVGDTTGVVLFKGLNQGAHLLITNHPVSMFDFEDCTLLHEDMSCFAAFASDGVSNVRNSSGQKLKNSFRSINGFYNLSNYGSFTDLATVSSFIPGFNGNAVSGPKFFGNFKRIAFEDMQFENLTGIAIDLGSATFDSFLFDGVYTPTATNVFIAGLASSGNVNAGGQALIHDVRFEGVFDPTLTNILASDIRWDFNNSSPLADSTNAADFFLIGGSETITTGSAGDWQEIGIPGAGGVSWDSDISDRFTIGTNGVATYIGEMDVTLRITARATVEKVGGGSNILETRLAKNWTGAASDGGLAKSRAQTQNATPTTVPVGALVPVVKNDNLRLIFSNTDGTADIIASVSSVEIEG